MLGKKAKANEDVNNARNHVATGTTVKGDIESSGGLRVDGKIIGNIDTVGKLVIGEKGEVKGNITCKDAEFEGTVKGNVNASGLLYLKESAKLEGDLSVHQLRIDSGAVYNGNCDMKSVSQQSPTLNGQKGKRSEAVKVG